MKNPYRLRYIIAFSWDGTYQEMFERFKAADFLQCRENAYIRKAGKTDVQEQDIYDHILQNFSDKPENHNSIGSVWDIEKSDIPEAPFELAWYPNRSGEKYYTLHIGQMGAYLFYNHIGFIWYELETKEKMDLETLISFQHSIKELNRIERQKQGPVLYEKDSKFSFAAEEKEDVDRKIATGEKGFHHFQQRIITNEKRVVGGEEKNVAIIRGTMFKSFTFGHWIENMMSVIVGDSQITIHYFASNTDTLHSREQQETRTLLVPEKANLFNYISLPEESRAELPEYAFYLSNGYKRSYLCSEGEKERARFLFANVCGYASQEGCGYYVAPTDENKAFFEGSMTTKVMLDYFLLYILALHQYYSLIVYARKIAEELPSEPKDYVGDENAQKKLEDLILEINTFFVKNVNASVSMIAHQNDFYEYVIERLRVPKSMESVSSGLAAIASIQMHNQAIKERELQRVREEREKQEQEQKAKRLQEQRLREKEIEDLEAERDRQINRMVSVISILAVFSAFVDASQLVDIFRKILDGTAFAKPWQFTLYNVIAVIIFGALVYAVVTLFRMIHKKK